MLPGKVSGNPDELSAEALHDKAMAIDLLDLAAEATLRNGGRVYAVKQEQVPETGACAAAILRY